MKVNSIAPYEFKKMIPKKVANISHVNSRTYTLDNIFPTKLNGQFQPPASKNTLNSILEI